MNALTLPRDGDTSGQIFPPPEEWRNGCMTHHGDCEYCDGNYFSVAAQESGIQRYNGSLPTAVAQTTINGAIADTLENLSLVKSKLYTHGDLILSRWSKKSKDKRGVLLNKAADFCFGEWPPRSSTDPLPENYFTAWNPEECREIIWPYALWMRIKDFAEDRVRLLTLLHLRTEHSLQSWAMHDTIESKGVFRRVPCLPFNSNCVQMFGEEYGRMVEFDNTLLHTWAIMSFPRTVATIDAQRLISAALLRVVDEIVADASPSGNSKWSEFVLNINRKGVETRWSFYEHPGLVPPQGFDTEGLLDRAKSKFNELADDMELLQTDPEYMLDYVSTLKASLRFKDHTPTTMAKWNLITMDVMGHRVLRLIQWARIVDAFQCVHEVFEKYRDDIRPGATLPPDVGIAMCVFSGITDEAAYLQCDIFMNALYHMEALKDCFAIVRVDGRLKRERLRPLDPSRHSDRILSCAFAVKNAMDNNRLRGARLDIQLLLKRLSSTKYEKAIDEEISSIALLDEMRVARDWSQLGPFEGPPPDACLDAHTAEEPQPSASAFLLDGQPVRGLNQNHPSIQRLSPLLHRFFEAPWPKDHKPPAWLEKVTESRKHLSAFWQAARKEWKRMQEVNGELNPKMRQLIDSMAFDVSPNYLEEVRKECELGEAEVHRMQAAQTRQKSAPQALQTTWGNSDDHTAVIRSNETKRTKIKTTGTSTSDPLDMSTFSLGGGSEVQSGNEQIILPPISVKQDSLAVFRKIFPSSTNSTLGSIKWTQLVQALADAGLVATQAPGSAVTFASADKGHINFHKPHAAGPVVDALMLRRMGKRLKKWFGWESDRFVLRAKEG